MAKPSTVQLNVDPSSDLHQQLTTTIAAIGELTHAVGDLAHAARNRVPTDQEKADRASEPIASHRFRNVEPAFADCVDELHNLRSPLSIEELHAAKQLTYTAIELLSYLAKVDGRSMLDLCRENRVGVVLQSLSDLAKAKED